MAMFKQVKTWLRGLLAAFIGGCATSVSAKVVLPDSVIDFSDMWKLAIVSGVINLAFYLKASPLPPSADDTETLTKSSA